MKISEIRQEANNLINDVFKALQGNNNKEDWKKALEFVNGQVALYEKIGGEKKFIWRKVRDILSDRFGKKFVK